MHPLNDVATVVEYTSDIFSVYCTSEMRVAIVAIVSTGCTYSLRRRRKTERESVNKQKKRQQGHVDLELLSRSVTSYTNCKEIWSCQTIKTRLIKLYIVSFVDSRSLLIYFWTFEKAFFTFFLQKHQKTQRFTILWLAAESRSWLTFWLGIRISEAAVNWCWQTTT